METTRSAAASSGGRKLELAKIEAVHEMVDRGDVALAYQPILGIGSREVFGYEVLLRSTSPSFSEVREVLAAAVQAGRIGELGRLFRGQAIRRCRRHPLFVNIEPNEFDFGWLVRPDDAIFKHRRQIYLEITESVPISHFEQCHSVLGEIRKKGVKLAIDDFGAGFSNIKYIADLEPEVVKLDRELVAGVEPGSRQFRLIRSIVQMCQEMEAEVVAEGVETETELKAVEDAGADFVQGYLFGQPASSPPKPGRPAGWEEPR